MLLPVTTTTTRQSLSPLDQPSSSDSILTRIEQVEWDTERASRVAGAVEAVTDEISALAILENRARASRPPNVELAERCGRLAENLAATRRVMQFEDDDTVSDVLRTTRSRLALIQAGDIAEL